MLYIRNIYLLQIYIYLECVYVFLKVIQYYTYLY